MPKPFYCPGCGQPMRKSKKPHGGQFLCDNPDCDIYEIEYHYDTDVAIIRRESCWVGRRSHAES